MSKAADTVKAKYGPDFYRNIGSKGGKVRNPNKGFGYKPTNSEEVSGRQRASIVGRKGGYSKSPIKGSLIDSDGSVSYNIPVHFMKKEF